MKLFKTDFSKKWITFELNEVYYAVNFKDSFLKGTYDIDILTSGDGKGYSVTTAKVKGAYPSLLGRIQMLVLLAKLEFKRFRQLHNQ